MADEADASAANTEASHEDLRDFITNQLAKFEAKTLVQNRLALRARTQGKRSKKDKNEITSTDDLEHMYKLIECLPQGNRCTQPPSQEFLALAREGAAEDEDPLETIRRALLLEEYTIQLCEELDETGDSGNCETVSPWALACSGIAEADMTASQKKVLHSQRYALQLHSILEQISSGAFREKGVGDEADQGGDGAQRRSTRRRRRKRRRAPEAMKNNDSQVAGTERGERRSKKFKKGGDERARPNGEYSSSENYKSEDSDAECADSDLVGLGKKRGEESQCDVDGENEE